MSEIHNLSKAVGKHQRRVHSQRKGERKRTPETYEP
jgi:hypothetical protein